jgi:hypothetical protein
MIEFQTLAEVEAVEARETALHNWLGKRNSYHLSELPAHIKPATNEERSAVEVYRFKERRPAEYFGYVKLPDGWEARDDNGRGRYGKLYGATGALTTWTGQHLGTVQFGRAWRDNFGGTRVPVTVKAITGDVYHGTYFASAGDYARIRRAKVTKS